MKWAALFKEGPCYSHLISLNVFLGDKILIKLRSYDHTKHVRLFILWCDKLLQMDLFVSLSLMRCPFKWQWPVNSPVTCLDWFLFILNNSVLFWQRLLEGRPSQVSVQVWITHIPGVFCSSSLWWPTQLIFLKCCRPVKVLWMDVQVPFLPVGNVVPLISLCPGAHIGYTCICSASSNWIKPNFSHSLLLENLTMNVLLNIYLVTLSATIWKWVPSNYL
jgi:hypothetical protein